MKNLTALHLQGCYYSTVKRLILLGPILFAAVLITLTIVQYDFMRGLGWHPIDNPTLDWPSGLALGRYGSVMTMTFIASGLIMFIFAIRLHLYLKPVLTTQAGTTLLALSSLALAGLAFTTDPTLRNTPATWHGRLHDVSFVLLGLTLFPAMILLGFSFLKDMRWRCFSFYTWLTVLFTIPTFAFKGAAFYFFLLAVILWIGVVAERLFVLASVDGNMEST